MRSGDAQVGLHSCSSERVGRVQSDQVVSRSSRDSAHASGRAHSSHRSTYMGERGDTCTFKQVIGLVQNKQPSHNSAHVSDRAHSSHGSTYTGEREMCMFERVVGSVQSDWVVSG